MYNNYKKGMGSKMNKNKMPMRGKMKKDKKNEGGMGNMM